MSWRMKGCLVVMVWISLGARTTRAEDALCSGALTDDFAETPRVSALFDEDTPPQQEWTDVAACPAGYPIDCGNGYCCDTGHPYCCANATCSTSSSCGGGGGGGGGSCPSGYPISCGNGYCCDSAHPYCCANGTCSSSSSCSGGGGGGGGGGSCPSGYPINCNNGYCCDSAHPYCCANGQCSTSASCSGGGTGGGTGGGGGSCPSGWYQCGASHCTPLGGVCCASVGLEGKYCPQGTTCTAGGYCLDSDGGTSDPSDGDYGIGGNPFAGAGSLCSSSDDAAPSGILLVLALVFVARSRKRQR